MTDKFCSHLKSYGMLYEGASAAYTDCLELMDRVLAGERAPGVLNQLEHNLNTWEMQTRELRSKFSRLSNQGEILLPSEGQNDQPVCAHCGESVERLEFAEFEFREDGSVYFRSQQIKAPDEGVPDVLKESAEPEPLPA